MFAKRLISSIALWAALLTVLFYRGPLASALFCCLVGTVALWEFYNMLGHGGLRCSKGFGIAGGLLLATGTWHFNVTQRNFVNTFEVLLLASLMIGLFTRQILDRHNEDAVQTVGNTMLGVIYIPWLFSFIPKIQYLYARGDDRGYGWLFVFYLVAVTKFCDIGAYLTGRICGRTKMIPRISPNKTWEGLIGGIAIAMLASLAAFKYLEPRISQVGFTLTDALILGPLLGVLGVLGDLAESLLKRRTQVKDSGGLLPGIGGALDLIDSLLFTAPVLYGYLVLFVYL